MAINLSKLNHEERLALCRRYFQLGFAFLPLLWLVNIVWFYRYTSGNQPNNSSQPLDENSSANVKKLKRYVCLSAVGATLWIAAIIAWIVIYQTNRRSGQVRWAELLTYIYPIGYV